MLSLGLTYFMLFELFPYLVLLIQMYLRMNKKGYHVDAYKEQIIVGPYQYSLMNFVDYSLELILHDFVMPNG